MSHNISINIDELNEEGVDKIINLLIDLRLYSVTTVAIKIDKSMKDIEFPETTSSILNAIKDRVEGHEFDELSFKYKFAFQPITKVTDDTTKGVRATLIDCINCNFIEDIFIVISNSCKILEEIDITKEPDIVSRIKHMRKGRI